MAPTRSERKFAHVLPPSRSDFSVELDYGPLRARRRPSVVFQENTISTLQRKFSPPVETPTELS